jgi:hypothetical protein
MPIGASRSALADSVCAIPSGHRTRSGCELQHIGGRGLLPQHFFEIARPRIRLVETTDVVDRDDCLGCTSDSAACRAIASARFAGAASMASRVVFSSGGSTASANV